MSQSNAPKTPGVPAPMNTVWPPSNPSGTVIPFPLPWGQTGCCPPGGMDALMKCYCDIQQASAFIGQIMLDQINNNPAIIAAIIAGIEASGSSLPTIGVTNGTPAQPGQVGEWFSMSQTITVPTTSQTVPVSMGILPPGDWTCFMQAGAGVFVTDLQFILAPQPAGFSGNMSAIMASSAGVEAVTVISPTVEALISVPTLVVFNISTNTIGSGPSSGPVVAVFAARRAR